MSITKIEWTGTPIPGKDIVAPGMTFNPWIGCTKVSPGCAHCYAEAEDKRRGWTLYGWGAGRKRTRTSEQYWRQPLKWNEQTFFCHGDMGWDRTDGPCAGDSVGPLTPNVFCASLSDWLDPEVPIQWLADLLDLIRRTPNLRWLLLSKRHEFWKERLARCGTHAATGSPGGDALFVWLFDWARGNPPANVAVGTSVEDQQRADERIPALLRIPARWRFLSCEPLLGPVDLRLDSPSQYGSPVNRSDMIHQIIIGGESGAKPRPCNIEDVRSLVRQGKNAGVKVFVKQLGANPFADFRVTCDDTALKGLVGVESRRMILRHPKGGDPSEWPEDLRVREYL